MDTNGLRLSRRLAGCSVFALLAACPAAALAQGVVQPSGAAASDEAEANSQTVASAGDIIVTANKREQNLSKVGATIAALNADDILQLRVASGSDLARVTPGLVYSPTINNTPVYTLRGVGFYEATLAAYPSTSLYIDQAPLPLPVMASKTVFDLERVEVLKGPQGTLFGNNATAGAINFVAAKPTREFTAGGSIGYARFNTVEVNGYVSGPLSETLQVRLAGRAEKGDEWQNSFSRDDHLGKKDNVAGRFLANWQPTERLRFALNVNGWQDRDDPQAPQVQRLSIQNPAGSVGLGGTVPATLPIINLTPVPEGILRGADWSPGFRPFTRNNFWQASLRTDFDLTSSITITALTSYGKLSFLNNAESDGTPLVANQFARHRGAARTFNQELRASNGSSGPVRWVVGANYERTTTSEDWLVYSPDCTCAAVNGFGLVSDDNFQKMTNYAGFANVEFDVLSTLTLKGGIRQSQANRDNNVSAFVPLDVPQPAGLPINATEFFNIVYPILYPGVLPITNGESFLLDTRTNADGTPVDPQTYLTTGRYFDKLREKSTSWSIGIDYKPTENLLFYANVAKGYKAGSFPILSAAIFGAVESVKQESLLDYEAGVKVQLFDRKLSIAANAFYYDYKNKQLVTNFVDPIFGILNKLQNVPKSRVKGAELNVVARPFSGLTVKADLTYLDATIQDYVGAIGSFVGTDGTRQPILASFDGTKLPFAPKLSYMIRADYDVPISERVAIFFGGGVNGQSESYSTLAVTPQDLADYRIAGYALVNATAGVQARDDSWRLSIWGTNIFNKFYVINRVQNYDLFVRYTGRPAEYGVTLAFKI